mmetsp:Transcript_52440/g.147169  ORF Transcript_52440/g.147169 Transcript_52440/m.147169 type:complete len:200 (+) Transcript_52440:661-1260(+)
MQVGQGPTAPAAPIEHCAPRDDAQDFADDRRYASQVVVQVLPPSAVASAAAPRYLGVLSRGQARAVRRATPRRELQRRGPRLDACVERRVAQAPLASHGDLRECPPYRAEVRRTLPRCQRQQQRPRRRPKRQWHGETGRPCLGQVRELAGATLPPTREVCKRGGQAMEVQPERTVKGERPQVLGAGSAEVRILRPAPWA